MDLSSTPERDALRTVLRKFLADRSPVSKVLVDMESELGYDAALWRELVGQAGLAGTWTPGGGDSRGAFRDLAVVLEELGRSLACTPFLSSGVLATSALTAVRSSYPVAFEHLGRIAAGQLIATVALPTADQAGAAHPVTVGHHADGPALTGRLPLVLDADAAGLLLIPAVDGDEPALFAVVPDTASVVREPLLTMDRTRRFAAVELRDAPASLVLAGPSVDALVETLAQLACVALACEQVGAARRCVELSADYARTRKQFGVPIGTFQAVKHQCANMLAALELAQSAATYAAWCVDADPAELPLAAHLAKSLCSETFRSIAADTIQVHGGLGFTWEHPAHLYYKRAKSSELFLGQPAAHRAQLADLLGF